jgi:hypothetical protein
MIDLWFVASNSLWILGLSILLAVLSWASWAASLSEDARGMPAFRAALARPGAQRAAWLGAALFCAGMAATGRGWWERVLWGALALIGLARAAFPGRLPFGGRRSPPRVERAEDEPDRP